MRAGGHSRVMGGGNVEPFDVGVALVPLTADQDRTSAGEDGVAGFTDTIGRRSRVGERVSLVIEKGDDAVRLATEAIARQIVKTARRIATVIEAEELSCGPGGGMCLESVQVTFGISLTGGVQAMFTAQTESSAQVAITLSRQPASGPPDEPRS